MEQGYIVYKLGYDISIGLGRKAVYKIACFLADLRYWFLGSDRIAMRKNFRIITSCNDSQSLDRLARLTLRNFAKNLVDFFRFGLMDSRFFMENTRIVGLEHIDAALRQGKGVLAVTAHLGIWEMGGIILAQKGYAVNAVAWEHKDPRVKKIFIYQRSRKGINVISLGIALRKCFRALHNNEVVAMLGDRDFSERGMKIKVKFFGHDVWVPRGPATLSLRTQAVIVPGFPIREKNDFCTLYFENPIEYNPTGDIETDIQVLTQKILNVIESYVRKYPDQWFVFNEFWENTDVHMDDNKRVNR